MYGREHVDQWALWADYLRAADGGREMPNQVALLVTTWLSEHQPKPPDD